MTEFERTRDAIPKQFCRKVKAQPPPHIRLFNGSRIRYLSFDNPNAILGDPADLIICDEAARINGDEFWRICGPMIAGRGGKIFFCSTFRGEENWFYKKWKEAYDGRNPDARAWLYKTETGIDFQGPAGKERLRRLRQEYPAHIWAEEFECEAAAHSNQVFRHLADILTDATPPLGPEPNHKYLAGIDIGDVTDNTAVVILDAATGQVAFTQKFELGTRHENIAKECGKITRQWAAYPILDATGGASGGHADSFVRFYKAAMPEVRPFIWSGNAKEQSKENVINRAVLETEQRTVTVPRAHRELIRQLSLYEFERYANGVKYSAPTGEHDDFVSAFCMAVWGKFKRWGAMDGQPLHYGLG